ncbi:MAG: hypothetical protein E7663_00420 [Ruminococcaceae bacterium]|nr:hypothetical protein [Oscillospiraceae bacterium]
MDLADYKIVYDRNLKGIFLDEVEELALLLNARAGAELSFVSDKSDFTSREILIGNTDREETAKVLASIEGEGYAIRMVGKHIVIVGTDRLMTLKAMQVFSEAYLTGEGKLEIGEGVICSNAEQLVLDSSFAVVYDHRLDDEKGSSFGSDYRTETENPDAYDYPVVAAHQILDALESRASLICTLDTDQFDLRNKEILVGIVDRSLCQSTLSGLNVNDYGVVVSGNKVLVAAANDPGLRMAITLFKNILTEAMDEDGVCRLPQDFSIFRMRDSSLLSDFPKPTGENIDFCGSVNVADGSVELVYRGNGVNADSFEAYCHGLLDAGCELLLENSIEGSRFKTLVNREKGYSLHVMYAAYKHAAAQAVSGLSPTLRVVCSSLKKVAVPDGALLDSRQTYEKVTDTMVTAVKLDYNYDGGNYGNSFVITLEDGSFIVCDGGGFSDNDGEELFKVLKNLFYRIYGVLPTASNPIRIAAWYMSHGHADHFDAFSYFCSTYGYLVEMDYIIANFPSDDETYNCYNPNNYVRDNFSGMTSGFLKRPVYIKVHTGQRLFVRNVELEVLYTHEDLYPNILDYFNDTSTVIRMHIRNTNGQGELRGEETTVLWLGDLYLQGSRYLRAMYGNALQTDIVQLAHHGSMGCEYEMYQLVAPECVLWTASASNYYRQTRYQNSSNWVTRANYGLAHLASVRFIIVCDVYDTTFTVTEQGPVYEVDGENCMFDASLVSTPRVYYGDAIIKKNQ